MFFVLVPCCAILRSTDYVIADENLRLSDASVAVTAGAPVTVSVQTTRRNLRSILFHITPPDCTEVSAENNITHLEIVVTDPSGKELARTVLESTDDSVEAGAADDIEVLLSPYDSADTAMEEELSTSEENSSFAGDFTVTFRSDAETETGAFHLTLSEDGSVWHRCTYLFLSNSRRILLETGAGWGILVLLYALLIQRRKNAAVTAELHPERFFLTASVVLGILYFLILPCMLVPDASNHFVRAYLLTKGMLLLPEGGQVTIPANLLPFERYTYTPYILAHNLREAIDWSHTVSYDAVNMALYSPINYLVQAIGIAIGSLFSQNTNFLQVFGSIVNYAACTAVLYWSIHKIPYGKAVLTILSLLPMAMQERASLSADSITYACVVAMIAFCLNLRARKEPMRSRDYVLMYLLLIAVASCKIVYFVIGFMILLIPNPCFQRVIKTAEGKSCPSEGNPADDEQTVKQVQNTNSGRNTDREDRFWIRRAICTKLSGCAVLLLFSLGWLVLASSYLGNTRGGGDTAAKVSLILHQPVRYLYILNKTVMNDGVSYLFEMVGSKMGATNIEISSFVIFLALLILTAAVLWDLRIGSRQDSMCHSSVLSVQDSSIGTNDTNVSAPAQQEPAVSSILGSLFMLLLSLAMVLLVMTSLYIQWTSLDAATYSIEGLQGRYFLPIVPAALVAMIGAKAGQSAREASSEENHVSPDAEKHFRKIVFAISGINVLVLIFCWSHASFLG